MRKLYLASIWAPDAIPIEEWKYRNLKRIMFPVVDLLFVLAGIAAVREGVPAINEFFPGYIVTAFSYLLILAGFVCLIGVSFPRLWPVEIAGKSVLLGLITGFILSLFILICFGESQRGFAFAIACVSICPIYWRLTLLGNEWQSRIQTRKLAALMAATSESGG